MLRVLVAALLLAGSAAAQDVGQLLAHTLGSGANRLYWLPDSADPAKAREAIGFAYLPTGGNAESLAVGYYARGPQGFGFVGPLDNLFSESPRAPRFLPDHIEVTTTMPLPGEPRCCPTGVAVWSIDRPSLAVTRLQ